MRLVELTDLPRPVEPSFYQGLLFNHPFFARLSYHVDNPPDPDPNPVYTGANIRVLNTSSDQGLCAAIQFDGVDYVAMGEWNGDEGTGHALCALGLRKNHFYEVVEDSADAEAGASATSEPLEPKPRRYVLAFRAQVFEITAYRGYSVTVERRSIIDGLR